MNMQSGWIVFAVLSAVFAAATSILAKIGIKGVDSNLATAIRTVVILVFAWGIVWMQGSIKGVWQLRSVTWIFLILSGLATGLSWIFYFRALQIGPTSSVVSVDKLSLVLTVIMAAVFLQERVTVATIVGSCLITIGVFIMTLWK